jgi:hypothetical protein
VLPIGATIVVIAAFCHDRLSAAVQRLQAKGYPLAVLWAPTIRRRRRWRAQLFDLAARLRELERARLPPFGRPDRSAPSHAAVSRLTRLFPLVISPRSATW